jgi:hypothetical protein
MLAAIRRASRGVAASKFAKFTHYFAHHNAGKIFFATSTANPTGSDSNPNPNPNPNTTAAVAAATGTTPTATTTDPPTSPGIESVQTQPSVFANTPFGNFLNRFAARQQQKIQQQQQQQSGGSNNSSNSNNNNNNNNNANNTGFWANIRQRIGRSLPFIFIVGFVYMAKSAKTQAGVEDNYDEVGLGLG